MALKHAYPAHNEKSFRSYATYANAVKALTAACTKLNIDDDLNYVIAANETGRFYPVTLPTEAQMHLAIALMHKSQIAVFRC